MEIGGGFVAKPLKAKYEYAHMQNGGVARHPERMTLGAVGLLYRFSFSLLGETCPAFLSIDQ